MPQTTNRFFDDIMKLMTNSAGVAQGMKEEFETAMRSQVERLLRSFHVPQREEFEAVKAMAEKARAENELLSQRLAALEAKAINTANDTTVFSTPTNQPSEPSMTV